METSIKPRYITDYVKRNAETFGEKLAIDFEGQALSWADLWDQVQARSHFFIRELGTKDQKLVALLLTNSPDFIILYLAALQAGHMVMPLDPAFKKLEIDSIIEQTDPQIIITTQRYQDKYSPGRPGLYLVEELPAGAAQPLQPLRLGVEEQVASLTFTSGTAGKPKVVPNTHANHMWNIKACSEVWDWKADDTLLMNLPLSHMHGLVIGLSGMIYHGNSLYLRQQSFDAEAVLAELSSGKISFFTHGPIAYAKMLDQTGDYDLSAVRVCISGSAPLPPALWRQFKDRFGVEIVETYGTSETGRIAGNHLDKKVLGSPGPPMPDVELKLSEQNELLVKSPGVFPGYFENPEATAAGWAGDGFWRTGDIAEITDGNIFLKGRLQEQIRRFGYTVSPRDVEWAMRQNPAIKDIFVIGRQIAGATNDELIYFVVTELDDESIQAYCKENLLFAWRPDRIIHLDELPKNRNGKISLGQLKKMAVEA